MSQQSDSVLVQLCIAIITSTPASGDPRIQVLTAPDERVPVPLGNLRNFADIRRALRLILHATMSHYDILSTNMTHCTAIMPAAVVQIQNNGLLGVTDDEVLWQSYTNFVGSMYHAPCQFPENCTPCREPALVIACFPASFWDQDPGTYIGMRDTYNIKHGTTLRRLSTIEQQRYVRITQQRVTTRSATNNVTQNSNSIIPASQSVQLKNTAADPTKGPKGRSLIGTDNKDNRKSKDYSKGTLRPATAEQGTKAESDTCLTCIRYNRKCGGTTMALVKSSRNERNGQWKCDQCRNPQRRCLWRPSLDKITTYDEAFEADGGKKLEKNTVAGRRGRAHERSAGSKKEGEKGSGGEKDFEEDDDGEDEPMDE